MYRYICIRPHEWYAYVGIYVCTVCDSCGVSLRYQTQQHSHAIDTRSASSVTEDPIYFTKMGRWFMLAWPVLLCYFGVAVKVFAKNADNDVFLRVSMNMETLTGRPSISHTFSNFELLNIVSLTSYRKFFSLVKKFWN